MPALNAAAVTAVPARLFDLQLAIVSATASGSLLPAMLQLLLRLGLSGLHAARAGLARTSRPRHG